MASVPSTAAASSTTEEWRLVDWTNGLYSISSYGRLRSNHPRSKGKILRPCPQRWGHLQYTTTLAGGTRRSLIIHREVLRAFVGPVPFPGALALHNDGDPSNNRPSNLRWGTAKDNYDDAVRHGTLGRGELNPSSKLTEDLVFEIRRRHESGEAHSDIARDMGIHRRTVLGVVRRENWAWLSPRTRSN